MLLLASPRCEPELDIDERYVEPVCSEAARKHQLDEAAVEQCPQSARLNRDRGAGVRYLASNLAALLAHGGPR